MKTNLIKIVFISMMVFLLSNCGDIGGYGEELARVPSLDNRLDAILYRSGGAGAISRYTYLIFICQKGLSPNKESSLLFQADHIKNLKINWRRGKILEIHYDKARIFKFTNFWHSRDVENFKYIVELQLVPNNKGHALSNRFNDGDLNGVTEKDIILKSEN